MTGAINQLLPVKPDAIPQELRNRDQWVCWRLEKRDGAKKLAKVPLDPKTLKRASSTDSTTWGTFAGAYSCYLEGRADGVGFVFTPADPFDGIDLDGCRNPESGVLLPWAEEVIKSLCSYTEVSPSGTGLHVILQGTLPPGGRRKGVIEMYSEGRYFTITGHRLDGFSEKIEQRPEELLELHTRVFGEDKNPPRNPDSKPHDLNGVSDDDALIQKACRSRSGEKFQALWKGDWSSYNSESEATLALCNLLAHCTDGDAARMDRLFRRSGLMRPKWDERRGNTTWGLQQIGMALSDFTSSRSQDNKSEETVSEELVLTDTWNGRRLVQDSDCDILWCDVFRNWYVYDATRYRKDETREVERRAENTVKSLYQRAAVLKDRKSRQELVEWAIRSESKHGINSMVESAKRMVPVHPLEFDMDPYRFNVLNGTINLKTGRLGSHRRQHRITKRADVIFDPAARCPSWLGFLNDIYKGNENLIDFTKRLFGYCLIGALTEQVIVILYGTGANGKSTLLGVLRLLAGDYAYHARPEVFASKRQEPQGFELVPLAGARVVTTAETRAGKHLDEALVKEMTGGEPVTCAPKYGDFFSFQPVFTPIIATNHKPVIRGANEGIWRRVLLVPFDVTIPEDQRDKELPHTLKGELSGILNWAL